jgi:hypothetical protein
MAVRIRQRMGAPNPPKMLNIPKDVHPGILSAFVVNESL